MNKAKKQKKKINNILPFIPDGDFYFTKGVEAFQKKKFNFSLKWLKKAIEVQPNNPLFNCQMSIVYTEIGAYHSANQLLNNVLQSSEYTDCYYLLANNYAHLGLLNDATKYAKLYLEKEPDGDFNEEVYDLLELIDFELDEEDEDGWLLDEEDDLLKYQETLFYLIENSDWEEAISIIEEMLVLFPDHLTIKHDYAQALFYTGHQEKAIQLEQEILEKSEHALQSNMNLALFYFEANQKQEYEAKIRKLLNVYPVHSDQQIKLAVILAKTENYTAAFERFSKINRIMARGHLSYYKWFSIAAFHNNEKKVAEELWQDGCLKHQALENHDCPWN